MPCGVTQGGLPVAVQFIGRRFEEALLIAIANRFSENLRDWRPKHPPAA
jgi:Asp-tRNA(Asn)/Glu-tRNA(Gln) amidotransferase A subunit family amidase